MRALLRAGFGALTRAAYYPLLDAHKGTPIAAATRDALRNESRSSDGLSEVTWNRLRQVVRHARMHSPFYRERYSDLPLNIGRTLDAETLATLPTVSKSDVLSHREQMRCPHRGKRVFACSTSGSTGMSMAFYQDSAHVAWTYGVVARGRSWFGLNRGDLELTLWARSVDASPEDSTLAALKYRLRNVIQFDVFERFDDGRKAEIVHTLREARPRVVYGYGSSIGELARYMDAHDISLSPEEAPRLVEFTADHMLEADQELARRVFGAPVMSAYGASEAPAIAQACPYGSLHVSTDHVHVEILRPDGSASDRGEEGEVVVTNLNNWVHPLIRYRLQDVGVWSVTPCSCGSRLPVMELRLGKAVDMIRTSATPSMSAHVFDYINLRVMRDGLRGIRQFMVRQHALDRFELMIIRETPFDPKSVELFEQTMREKLGSQIKVERRFVDSIPVLSSGKRRYFERCY